jgi:ABC-type dipeptide/oligopeptide/nickel transport system permease component
LSRGTLMYIGQRMLMIAFTVLAVSSIVFLGIHRLPGDALFNEHLHGTQYQLLLHHYGLDRPLWDQYTSFITGLLLHGNLGESLVNRGVPIAPLVLRELSVSAEVGLVALIFTIGIGMLFGVVAAIRQNTWVDYLLSTTSVIGYSMPSFVIATFLILVFAVWLDNLTQGTFYFQIGWEGRWGTIGAIWLPAFALAFLTRASLPA